MLLSMLLAACGNNKGAALQDPVWKILPDVKGGNIHKYGMDISWLYGGPIANSQMLDDVLESIVK